MQDTDYLKRIRIKCGFTQQEVADRIGVTKATISKYEKGIRRVNHIEELAALYNVDPVYILTGKTSAEWQKAFENNLTDAMEAEREHWTEILLSGCLGTMQKLLDKLNDEGQQKAIERVEELTEIPKYQRQPEGGGQGAVNPQEDN